MEQFKIDSTEKDITITFSREIADFKEVQTLIDLIRYKALVSGSKATDEDVEQITKEVDRGISRRISTAKLI